MLNEKDFTEIGKRIYDLEADPPQGGWNKIAGGLRNQTGKKGFISRNWWKPLLLLIPLSVWISVDNDLLQNRTLTGQLSTETQVNSDRATSPQHSSESSLKSSGVDRNENQPIIGQNPTELSTIDGDEQNRNEREEVKPQGTSPKLNYPFNENQNSATDLNRKEMPSHDGSVRALENATSSSKTITLASANPAVDTAVVMDHSSIENKSANKVLVGSLGESRKPAAEPIVIDSVLTRSNESVADASDSSTNAENQQSPGGWRATVSVAPNYLMKSLRPVMNDDVLITKMESRKSFERIGFTAAFGVGKEIRKNLFLDLQGTFSSQHERFAYTYTTGKVDTLIARQEDNGSVRVTPVYAAMSADISSRLNYGGIRLGATYYFWDRGRTRFNISAAGAANFLLYSNVKENISGVKGGIGRPAKTTKTLTLSAGYNIKLGSAWEAQINPSITYFSGNGNSYQQVYNLNQRSFGINFTASKFF